MTRLMLISVTLVTVLISAEICEAQSPRCVEAAGVNSEILTSNTNLLSRANSDLSTGRITKSEACTTMRLAARTILQLIADMNIECDGKLATYAPSVMGLRDSIDGALDECRGY